MSDRQCPQRRFRGERADLPDLLVTSASSSSETRHVLRYEVRDLPDEQAASAPTVSELSLGRLIKHVSRTETAWIQRAVAMG